MEQVLWLSALGALLALDHAMVGQFMFAQPLVVGSIFGVLLGDLPTGLLAGAMVQLLWINVLPVGAYIPSDYTITGGMTAALTVFFMQTAAMNIGPAMVLALGVAIPAGIVSGKLDILVRHFNSRLAARSEAVVESEGLSGVTRLNVMGLLGTYLRNFLLYLLWLGPLAVLLGSLTPLLSVKVMNALGWVFWFLPMLSFAVVLDLIVKEESHWWIGAAFLVVGGLVWLWPGNVLLIFTAALGIGAGLAWRRRAW
ncbi:PTS sugar transporter subunit IIC [bacterium]|nr:PTS sugar transporter subunit IIC [bacterium]